MGRGRSLKQTQRKNELSKSSDKVQVKIRYNSLEKDFEGNVEETWILLNNFYSKFVPTFEIAKHLWLSVDLQTLARDSEGLIAFSPEGPSILVSKNKLTDNETIAMWLLASYLGKRLDFLESDALTKDDLQTKLGKSAKITGTRLGELVKAEWVSRNDDEKFIMTTFGVVQMQREVLPRIIAKTGV
jgi:hypothetical protein